MKSNPIPSKSNAQPVKQPILATFRSTNICVINATGADATITLVHLSGDCGGVTQSQTTSNVSPGDSTPYLFVTYNTGAGSSNDHWFCSAIVNGVEFATEGTAGCPDKQCNLETEDANQYLSFTITTSTFYMNLPSGNCTTPVNPQ
jgi:hypothetical protein